MEPRVAAAAPFLLFLITALYMAATTEASCDARLTQQPSPYIIDGSNSPLTLTCNFNDASEYNWHYNDSGSFLQLPCQTRPNSDKTCRYVPNRQNAGQEIRCQATFSNNTLQSVFCTPDITYPPQSKPVINATQGNKPLGKGDSLTCFVEEGRPAASINFTCFKPDQERGKLGGDGMSSTITMTNFNDEGDGNMTCSCSATWAPNTTLYNHIETKTVEIQFEPIFLNFSKVDSPSPSQNTTLIVSCVVLARPPPTIKITHPNATTSKEERFTSETDNNVYVLNATLKKECLEGVQCIATNTIASDIKSVTRRRRRRATGSATLDCSGKSKPESSASLGIGLGVGIGVAVFVCVVVVVAVLIRKRRRQNKEQSCQPDKSRCSRK